jgi:hypothetical protein
MNSISPEQIEVLQSILRPIPPKVAAVLGCTVPDIEAFLAKVTTFVKNTHLSLPGQRYALQFLSTVAAGNPLDLGRLKTELGSGHRVLTVDSTMRLAGAVAGETTVTASSERSKTSTSFEILIHGSYAYYLLDGRLLQESDLVRPGQQSQPISIWHRPFDDFPLLLADHFEQQLSKEQTRYWHNKAERILLKGADGTEYIFHGALFWWLQRFVKDGIDVYAEPQGHGQDRTDITVVTLGGKQVIEVKWLGKNESNTEYKEQRIQDGVDQVRLYMEREPSLIRGFVVIYDGRCETEHATQCSFLHQTLHPRCDRPMIMFLPSDTPTETVKKMRKKRKAPRAN